MEKKDEFIKLNKAIDKKLDGKEKELAKEYAQTLANVKQALAEAYEKYSDNDILTREEMVKFGRLAKLENYLAEEIQKLTKNQIRITQSAIKDTFLESYYRYGYFIENQVELAIYKLVKPEIVDAMIFNPLDLIKWDERVEENTTTLTRTLREVLTLGLAQGLGYSKLAREVTDKLGIGLNNALRITRTECRRVQESANLSTMQEARTAGVITKKMWVSTLDKRTRDTHRHLDGQIVGIDEKFKSKSGYTALAPHQFGVANEDIHCRCTMIVVVDGLEPSVRRARDENGKNKIIKYKTYNDWYKDLEDR